MHGRVVNEISKVNGTAGRYKFVISKNLQDYSFNRLGENAGSIVVLNINTGEILVSVTKPSFDSMILLEKCIQINGRNNQ